MYICRVKKQRNVLNPQNKRTMGTMIKFYDETKDTPLMRKCWYARWENLKDELIKQREKRKRVDKKDRHISDTITDVCMGWGKYKHWGKYENGSVQHKEELDRLQGEEHKIDVKKEKLREIEKRMEKEIDFAFYASLGTTEEAFKKREKEAEAKEKPIVSVGLIQSFYYKSENK